MTFNLWGLLRTSVQKSGSIDCLLASGNKTFSISINE